MAIDLDYIQNLAGSHEGVDVEFKETTGQLDRGMETLCGMLNGEGGIFNTEKKAEIRLLSLFFAEMGDNWLVALL